MSIDTQTRIAEIKARAAAATPGPWRVAKWEDGSQDDTPASNVFWDDGEAAVCIDILTRDATFIAHARADLEWAVQEIADRQREYEKLQEECSLLDAELYGKDAYITRLEARLREEMTRYAVVTADDFVGAEEYVEAEMAKLKGAHGKD